MAGAEESHVNAQQVTHSIKPAGWTNGDYIAKFGWCSADPEKSSKYPSTTRLAKAYEVALDIRKFEIDLYWKRSTNFWVLVAGISAALGLLATGTVPEKTVTILGAMHREIACQVLSFAAMTVCCAWWLVNRASKFWQKNWESQVEILEQEVLGPLYKTVLSAKGHFEKTAHYSVSDINQAASAYFLILFFSLGLYFSGFQYLFAIPPNQTAPVWQFDLGKALTITFNAIFILTFRFGKAVKTTAQKNRLDGLLEATIRSVDVASVVKNTSIPSSGIPPGQINSR